MTYMYFVKTFFYSLNEWQILEKDLYLFSKFILSSFLMFIRSLLTSIDWNILRVATSDEEKTFPNSGIYSKPTNWIIKLQNTHNYLINHYIISKYSYIEAQVHPHMVFAKIKKSIFFENRDKHVMTKKTKSFKRLLIQSNFFWWKIQFELFDLEFWARCGWMESLFSQPKPLPSLTKLFGTAS